MGGDEGEFPRALSLQEPLKRALVHPVSIVMIMVETGTTFNDRDEDFTHHK